MSIRDFEKYRHSLSYTLPTPEEVKKKPYGVVDKGVYGKYFKELKYYEAIFEARIFPYFV